VKKEQEMTGPDQDLLRMDKEQLLSEIKRLRAAIRVHRNSSGHELCWYQPELWSLLPEHEKSEIQVPDWPEFIKGCLIYRQSLDESKD